MLLKIWLFTFGINLLILGLLFLRIRFNKNMYTLLKNEYITSSDNGFIIKMQLLILIAIPIINIFFFFVYLCMFLMSEQKLIEEINKQVAKSKLRDVLK